MSNIVWWEIESAEPERFQEFHGALSGWEFTKAYEDTELGADYWVIRIADGTGIGGLQRADAAGEPSSHGTRVYFPVEDLEATLARVVELGGAVVRERVALDPGHGWIAVYRDPTGVLFGLWSDQVAAG